MNNQPSVSHGSFTIGRTLNASVDRVFNAFANAEAKQRWFSGPTDTPMDHTLDFTVGGHEHASGKLPDGRIHRFEAVYFDIVENARIVYAYEMYLNDVRISVSLATIELQPMGTNTYLQITEDGAYLDGHDTMESRQCGTEILFDALTQSLAN